MRAKVLGIAPYKNQHFISTSLQIMRNRANNLICLAIATNTEQHQKMKT